MVVITYQQGHGWHFEAFGSLVEAQAFINELFIKGVDFEVKFH